MKKITIKDFKEFQKYCHKWQDKLWQKRWEIIFHLDKLEWSRAQCAYSWNAMVIHLTLANEWQEESFSQRWLEMTAFHEMCELLLLGMQRYMWEAWYADWKIEEETHQVIRTLENLMFK